MSLKEASDSRRLAHIATVECFIAYHNNGALSERITDKLFGHDAKGKYDYFVEDVVAP